VALVEKASENLCEVIERLALVAVYSSLLFERFIGMQPAPIQVFERFVQAAPFSNSVNERFFRNAPYFSQVNERFCEMVDIATRAHGYTHSELTSTQLVLASTKQTLGLNNLDFTSTRLAIGYNRLGKPVTYVIHGQS
jgi:hypothetical protein